MTTTPARGLRILHIGNIANNAYSNAKLLREQGHECHVACYDYYHFACCCEWQELDSGADRSLLGDPNYPNFWRLGAQRPRVPAWFAHGPQIRVITYLRHLAAGEARLAAIARACLSYARFKVIVSGDSFGDRLPWSEARFQAAIGGLPLTASDLTELLQGRMFERLDALVRQGLRRTAGDAAIEGLTLPLDRSWLEAIGTLDPDVAAMLADLPAGQVLAAAGIEADSGRRIDGIWPEGVDPADAEKYGLHIAGWRWLMRQYDLVMAYGPEPILPFLAGHPRYVAYEHGTLRDIPHEDNSLGRLVAAAYPAARAVFVTNNDYLTQERQLPIEPHRLHPLPHAFDERPLRAFAAARGRRRSDTVTFFAPARQDWIPKVPIMMKNNHFVVHAARRLKDRGITGFRTIFVEWGVDLAATKALIAELGVEEHFVWVKPLPKHQLWEHYLDSHAVIDQFLLPSLSGVSFEALSLGCRVLTRDDGVANRLAFGEQPPFLDGHDVDSVTAAMLRVIEDPDDAAGIGASSWSWVDRCHSGRRIVEIQEKAFADVMAEAQAESAAEAPRPEETAPPPAAAAEPPDLTSTDAHSKTPPAGAGPAAPVAIGEFSALKPSFLGSVRRRLADTLLRDVTVALASRLDTIAADQAGLAARIEALQAELAAVRRELVERLPPDEASLRAIEERLRRLEPSAASGEAVTDAAEVRDNLLAIRLGQLESRLLTVLEGPYFDRVAERVRADLAQQPGPAAAPAPLS